MSVTNLKRLQNASYVGSGAPADGDSLVIRNLKYPVNTIYVDKANDKTYLRTAVNKVAADFEEISSSSGSGGSGELTEGTLDISGLSAIDLSSVSTKDIVNLTSTNTTETIDAITGIATGKIVRLQPESGLEVTFTGTAVASAGAGDIVLPTTDFVADGTKRDYLSVTKDGSFVKQVDANNFI